MSGRAAAHDVLLGSPMVAAPARLVTSRRLRVLAYHGVPDPEAFAAHLDHIVGRYVPVTGAQVAAWLERGSPLPRHAVWLTFDDGRRDVVEAALPMLVDRRIPATLFVCPGLLDGSPYWWSVVEDALSVGPVRHGGRTWTDWDLVIRLTAVPDSERRHLVDRLAGEGHGAGFRGAVTRDHVRRWLGAGLEVGNHTWDHPCLDHCGPSQQVEQITRAHEELDGLLDGAPRLFAYPNGDWTPEAERCLAELGYGVALLFDHHLVSRRPAGLRLSRLRLDSDAPPARARAVLSGSHSGVFSLRAWLRELRGRVG